MGNNYNCNTCACQQEQTITQSQIQPKTPIIMQKLNKTLADQPTSQYAIQIHNTFNLPQQIKKIIQNQSGQRQFKFDQIHSGKVLPSYKILQSKAIYMGQWKQGLPNGKGKVFYENGSYFQGEFYMGKAQCSDGMFVYPQRKAYYRGSIKQNKAHGYGKMVYQDRKFMYIGNWKHDVPEGQGEQIYQDGSRFKGHFKNGKKDGKGKYYWSDKSQYDGDFKDGYMEGKGIQKFADGQIYEGQFKKNKRVGIGKLTTNVGFYQGNFVNDKKQGQGKFIWNDKRVYIGSFKDGKPHGKGKMIFPSGQQSTGVWENGINIRIQKTQQLPQNSYYEN